MIPSEIKPATFRLVTQFLNELHYQQLASYLANTKKYVLSRICSPIYVPLLQSYCLHASVFIVKELNSAVLLASLSQ
jgi:hypothetical protein